MSQQKWPAELDALIAAPDHHKLMLENEQVHVLDTLIRPGDTTPVHTHENPSVFYILSRSDFVRYDGNGNVMVDTRTNDEAPLEVLWGGSLDPHAVENVGDADLPLKLPDWKYGSIVSNSF